MSAPTVPTPRAVAGPEPTEELVARLLALAEDPGRPIVDRPHDALPRVAPGEPPAHQSPVRAGVCAIVVGASSVAAAWVAGVAVPQGSPAPAGPTVAPSRPAGGAGPAGAVDVRPARLRCSSGPSGWC